MTRPLVAIVGRPNVGKSTLFNRLVRERLAITEDLPGTTRDRVYADTSWGGHDFTLIDTGGLEPRPTSDMRQKIRDQVEVAIDEADVIIFLVDVLDGVTLPDQEIAQSLRRSRKPLLLAANKADNEERRYLALQFHELALGEPIAISAYHGGGVADLMEEVSARLPVPAPPPSPTEEEPGVMKLAIVGRPNVGKSLLLNAIVGQERVIVAETPGTTRDAIDTSFSYRGEPMLLIDTAGIRRRGRIGAGVERYSVLRALRAISRADVALLVTEAAEPITAQDSHIAGYIRQALKGMVIVVNKWDLATELGNEEAGCTREIRERLKFFAHAPILYVSAKLRQGIEGVLATAKQICEQRLKRLPQETVNSVIKEAAAAHAPPSAGGKHLKILGAHQAEVNPPTFVFQVNNPALMHFSYERYLENRLRKAFGFKGTPLRLLFRSRRGERWR